MPLAQHQRLSTKEGVASTPTLRGFFRRGMHRGKRDGSWFRPGMVERGVDPLLSGSTSSWKAERSRTLGAALKRATPWPISMAMPFDLIKRHA